MAFLDTERATLERLLPGLDAALSCHPLEKLESPGSPIVPLFKEAGGPAVMIPSDRGGKGGSMLDVVRVNRAIAARSPSLSIISTMHNFSIFSLVDFVRTTQLPAAVALLEGIAAGQLICASAVYEGISKPNPATMLSGRRERGGFVIKGTKKPCTSSRSLDLAFVSLIDGDATGPRPRLGLALVHSGTPGLSHREFWTSPALRASESDELVFDDVWVPEAQVFFPDDDKDVRFESDWTLFSGGDRPVQTIEVAGPVAFMLLSCAAYIGMASALVERVLVAGRGTAESRMALVAEVEGAMSATEAIARAVMAEEWSWELLARSLLVRYSVQGALQRAAENAAELVGSATFFQTADVSLLLTSVRALAYHPPTRANAAVYLDRHLFGDRKR